MFSFLDGDQLRQSGMVLQALVSHFPFDLKGRIFCMNNNIFLLFQVYICFK